MWKNLTLFFTLFSFKYRIARSLNQTIRQEQDAAYLESLRADQEKERRRCEEEERKRKIQEEKREKALQEQLRKEVSRFPTLLARVY